ncbi:unnamed protein product [Adineta steineri]|uniref:Uncharacterized protein n=1 Tax=Adineta steineri TaxID=433720 RepID=A0A814QKC0_9BILA|nr:unnamed protein product [Adineta steineri]CAF1538969.1 unnamed protein product [Adineta steineri]
MLSVVSAHSTPGLTDICYTKDGNHFITCGQDGDIHVFETKTDQVEHIRCADQCHCLAVHKYHLFVGTNRNELEVRSFPHGDSLPSLVHFTQPVSALCLSNSSLFIGTRDFKVVMMNLNDDSNKMKYFDGHQAPILALNVYEDKRWLATSCCDGSVRVFNIDKQTLVKQFNVITKSNDIETASSLVKIDWDKTDHAEKNNLGSYWLLGINDFNGKFQLRVIELRGQSFPDLVPWPLVSIISLPLALYQIDTEKSQLESDYLKIKLFNNSTDDEEFSNNERQCLIKMFASSCKSNREYRAFEICQLMDSIALQLAVRYATKSGKISLAQKITDELIEQKKDQEQEEKLIQRSSSPPPARPPTSIPSSKSSSSSISIVSSAFEEIKQTRPKVTTPTGPFSNPFRKKVITIPENETSTTDELSKWKPSVNKSRLPASNKITTITTATIQSDINVETITENEDNSLNAKRKIDESENNDEEIGKNKRNKLQQFACNR